jgi:polar amino acid transport system ATP-binding protein
MCGAKFNLFPHLTVLQNCMLAPRRVKRVPVKEAKETAMRLLERVHIAEQANKCPAQLSVRHRAVRVAVRTQLRRL